MKPAYNKTRPREDGPLIVAFAPVAGDLLDVSGTIEFCRTVNTGSGWGFGKLWAATERCTVPFTGLVSQTYETAQVTVRGRWKEHPEYGWQLEASAIIVDLPQDALGTRMWLEEHFPDIGPVRAAAIVRAFPGEQLWQVIEHEPDRLQEVEGIGPVLTKQIADMYEYVKAERDVFIGLVDYGLKATQVRDAVRRWGRTTLDVLRADPYRLVEIEVPFKQVDSLGMRNGIKRDDPRRIAAGYHYAMQKIEQDGHTCTSLKALQSMVASVDVLGIRLQNVVAGWPLSERSAVVAVPGSALSVCFAYRLGQEQAIARFVRCALEVDPGNDPIQY
jgi:hypothetical protein